MAFCISVSACSLFRVSVGITDADLRVSKSCLDVFQNNFMLVVPDESIESSLSKYSFFDLLMLDTVLFRFFYTFPIRRYKMFSYIVNMCVSVFLLAFLFDKCIFCHAATKHSVVGTFD